MIYTRLQHSFNGHDFLSAFYSFIVEHVMSHNTRGPQLPSWANGNTNDDTTNNNIAGSIELVVDIWTDHREVHEQRRTIRWSIVSNAFRLPSQIEYLYPLAGDWISRVLQYDRFRLYTYARYMLWYVVPLTTVQTKHIQDNIQQSTWF